MKNEAPEKLYVDVHENLSDSILYGFTEKRKDTDIEYIRKDAFIEKACEWLKNNLSQKVSVISGGYVHINFDNAIEEFIKYMEEGE